MNRSRAAPLQLARSLFEKAFNAGFHWKKSTESSESFFLKSSTIGIRSSCTVDHFNVEILGAH